MRYSNAILLPLLIAEVVGQHRSGGHGTLTIEAELPTIITVGTPAVTFRLQIPCNVGLNGVLGVQLLGYNDTIKRGKSQLIIVDKYGCAFAASNKPRWFQMSCGRLCSSNITELNITMVNMTQEDDMTSFVMTNRRETIFRRKLMVKYCSMNGSMFPTDLEPKLQLALQLYSYGDAIQTSCRENSLFLNETIYSESMIVTCIENAGWSIPSYECVPVCEDPGKGNMQVKDGKRMKYKYKTRAELECSQGRLYYAHNQTHFESTVTTICQYSGTWSHDELQCWTGDVVDFTVDEFTSSSGQRTIFSCSAAAAGNKIRMKVGEQVVTGKDHAWLNITLTPRHHGDASCEEIDGSGREINRGQTMINVLYPPYMNEDNSRMEFGLIQNDQGYAIIEFFANPIISKSGIRITKDERTLPNFYLVVEEPLHRVVLHFLKVDEQVYGWYNFSVISHLGNLSYAFNIFEKSARQEGLSASTAAGVTFCAVFGLAVTLACVLLLVRKFRSRNETITGKKVDGDRTYEEIGSDAGATVKKREQGGVRYENTGTGSNRLSAARKTDGGYETPIGRSNIALSDGVYEYNN